MWPVPLLIGICLAPESPWWLVRKGRIEQAKKSLLRLTSLNKETNFDADDTIAMMVHTTALEEKVNSPSSGIGYPANITQPDYKRSKLFGLLQRH